MPMSTAASSFDADVEKATSESNVGENTTLYREICDKAKHAPTPGPRDCLRSIVKRMNHKVPHVAMQALALLDACVKSSGYFFQMEMATPDFISECKTLINGGKAHQRVVQKLKSFIKKWAENEFKVDSNLSPMVSLYTALKNEGHGFNFDESGKDAVSSSTTKQEDDDLAKAIALSLKESGKQVGGARPQSGLYPIVGGGAAYSSPDAPREPRKVRTLYDFEAAEDNEMTFKAGEIISVLDDSDANWWKGSSYRGEGLFPANFVTADLTVEPDQDLYKSRKSVRFHEEVEVKVMEPVAPPAVEIDEARIDAALALIQNADPTDLNADSAELTSLEEQCREMGPLIDQELEKIDRLHNSLSDSNTKLMEAFTMYHSLMRELPTYGYVSAPRQQPMQQQQQPMQQQQQPMQQQPMQQLMQQVYQQYIPGPPGQNGASAMGFAPQGPPPTAQGPSPGGYIAQGPPQMSSNVDPNSYRSNVAYAPQSSGPGAYQPHHAPFSQPYGGAGGPYAPSSGVMPPGHPGPGGYMPPDPYRGSPVTSFVGAGGPGADQQLQYMPPPHQPMAAQSLL